MTYKLRPYQEEAVAIAVNCFKKDKPFIIQAATGAGKSLIIAEICYRLNEPVLILQPSRELVSQNHAKLASYGVSDISIYSAGLNSKEIAKYCYATIQSIYKKPELFAHFKYVIIDECDVLNPKTLTGMYSKFLGAIGCKKVCGLTATPYRIVTKYFMEYGVLTASAALAMITRISRPTFWSQGIVYKVETQELIDQGYLCPVKYYNEEVDLSSLKVNSTGADYTEASLESFWNDRRLISLGEVILRIDKHCQRNLIFCSSLRQANRALIMLEGGGLSVAMVTGETPSKERERIVREFKEGTIRHLINMGVFTVGFDVPELDSIVMCRPTMSVRLYYQILGRGIRKDPNRPQKILHFFDVAGVVDRLGKVENIRITKEDGGFKDQLESDIGILTGKQLYTYQIPKKEKLAEVV